MQHMPHFLVLGIHVHTVLLVAGHLYRITSCHIYPVMVQPFDFQRIVGHQHKLPYAQVSQDGAPGVVFPEVSREPEGDIGLHSVHALLLQFISLQLVYQADASPLLPQIDQHSAPGLLYAPERLCKLLAAVTSHGPEHIAGKTLRMDPAQHRSIRRNIAFHQGHMMLSVYPVHIPQHTECAVSCRQRHVCHPFHPLFRMHPVSDDALHSDDLKPVDAGELKEPRGPHHSAVIIHYLTAQAALPQAGYFHKVHCSLGVPFTLEHASGPCLKREHMPRPPEVLRPGVRAGAFHRSHRTLCRRNARSGGDMVYGDGECRAVVVGIVRDHLGQSQFLCQFPAHGHAYQPLGIRCHEVNILRSGIFCCTDNVPLVLAVRVIHHYYHFPLPKIFDSFLYCIEFL